ncbi:phosphocholine-specific phospholipase C [Deminuibacter soli]|uniref:phospholipase C n=1 Tax=Deminuibacter soli TaxID=2291815 RepID=A0A3E1NFS9_9BACT|nr:phospholipase C, phosphocholine-specific [Deminuibacter soli]RFM26819.1 phospholipase C, phosphocholine-specific [Deminuibacter soli]
MDTRREFLRKSMLLSGAAGFSNLLPGSIQRALAIDPAPGSTFLDAEHIVILMQENRSFDHCFGTLRGVRGFNDPRAIRLPNDKPVWFQSNAAGETYAPFRLDIRDTKITWMGSLPHSRASQVDAHNQGKYDQWLIAKASGNKAYAGMPLTMGYYSREDLPFNYAMADAFTICDQNFCSAMTSTTPNRSFFWTGKITHEENGIPKANIRNDDFSYGKMDWKTFPELLEANGIAWKFYQNALSCGGGFEGEERSWLSNFGCNLLEFFKPYNVKFAPQYIKALQKQADTLPGEINKLQEESPSDEDTAAKIKAAIQKKQEVLSKAQDELLQWNAAKFEKLSPEEQRLFFNAFTVNEKDPDYRSITSLTYEENGASRTLKVPKGDLLHQFRSDVENNQLPTVSWLAAPQNFSDHPSAPWYGAWYVSEVLDILTKNPEVWKKTIFIVTYDENDGYFDHVPPFSIPDNNKPGTGKCSAGIETEIEFVRLENELKQGVPKKQAREGAIGLGFRVPMIIASPWSRGGKVCSQLFDHTSTLQFLETFVNKKFNKSIHVDNISQWRRTICGDLTTAFTPFNNSQLERIPFLERNTHVENIFNARFKQEPAGYRQVTDNDVQAFVTAPASAGVMPRQEPGVRPSAALPYELHTNGQLSDDRKKFVLRLQAGNAVWKGQAAGAPFSVYAPGKYEGQGNEATETSRVWSFAAKAGDTLTYEWPLHAFENKQYHLRAYGPNGFYREFKGTANDQLLAECSYESKGRADVLTGNIVLHLRNAAATKSCTVQLKHGSTGKLLQSVNIGAGKTESVVVNLDTSHQWYDVQLSIDGTPEFFRHYCGRVETGKEGVTDPVMGGVV